jgi:hypothetical protein
MEKHWPGNAEQHVCDDNQSFCIVLPNEIYFGKQHFTLPRRINRFQWHSRHVCRQVQSTYTGAIKIVSIHKKNRKEEAVPCHEQRANDRVFTFHRLKSVVAVSKVSRFVLLALSRIDQNNNEPYRRPRERSSDTYMYQEGQTTSTLNAEASLLAGLVADKVFGEGQLHY